jgi:hypothetical protein
VTLHESTLPESVRKVSVPRRVTVPSVCRTHFGSG